jgi:hypothetical protein
MKTVASINSFRRCNLAGWLPRAADLVRVGSHEATKQGRLPPLVKHIAAAKNLLCLTTHFLQKCASVTLELRGNVLTSFRASFKRFDDLYHVAQCVT